MLKTSRLRCAARVAALLTVLVAVWPDAATAQSGVTGGPVHRRAADPALAGLRVAHRRRRQPQRDGRGHVPQARRADVAPRPAAVPAPERARHRAAGRATAPARSTTLHGAEHVRGQHPQSRARNRLRMPLRAQRSRTASAADGADDQVRTRNSRAPADGGNGLPRLSRRLQGPKQEPAFTG